MGWNFMRKIRRTENWEKNESVEKGVLGVVRSENNVIACILQWRTYLQGMCVFVEEISLKIR